MELRRGASGGELLYIERIDRQVDMRLTDRKGLFLRALDIYRLGNKRLLKDALQASKNKIQTKTENPSRRLRCDLDFLCHAPNGYSKTSPGNLVKPFPEGKVLVRSFCVPIPSFSVPPDRLSKQTAIGGFESR